MQEYHSKELRVEVARAPYEALRKQIIAVVDQQLGADPGIAAAFGCAKFKHVLFYRTSKQSGTAEVYSKAPLKFRRIAQLNSESVRVFHMEALRALFVRLRSNTARLTCSTCTS